jgi:uroporphyrinogen III methyltransferase/synthase
MAKRAGKVYLVGAGPGAIDLITVRGAEILGHAEVVVYDNLVNPGLLRLAPASAELIYAGKRGGAGKSIEQSELNTILLARARKGMAVVRLKGGDPFIFGRGGEEAEALSAAGIEFEIVPGVTSATAVPAFAGIPLTHREHGSFVAFVTGHEDESKGRDRSVPWEHLARAAASGGTLVILMATARLKAVLRRLADAGLAPSTPAAAIQWGTIAGQKTVSASLGTLAGEVERASLGAPAIVVVGECSRLREHLRWAERMPLFGRRIVVTRAGDNASAFARELRALGAEAVEFPTIATIPPDSYAVLDAAIARLDSFDWMIFTSATGVEAFVERLRVIGRDIRSMGAARVVAIGPATAARLREHALVVDAIPAKYRAEAIIEAIGADNIRGARILIPRAQVAREILPRMLREAGAAEVMVAPAYKTVVPAGAALDRMKDVLAAGGYDLVAFTSSSTATNFSEIMGRPKPGTRAAVIGPITEETARRLGFDVVAKPAEYTVPALVAAIRDYFAPSAEKTVAAKARRR